MDMDAKVLFDQLYKQDKDYWEDWLDSHESVLTEEFDPSDRLHTLETSLYEVIKLAVENEQYKPSFNEFDNVQRVVKIWVDLSQEELKKYMHLDFISVYGIGLFTLVDGILISKSTRDKSGFDTKGKSSYFDMSLFPEEIRKDYDFRVMTPALGGLFIPKKSLLTEWLERPYQIEYFELQRSFT